MTDTPRTLAEVQALLANNTSGNISAQDMRDMVMSIVNPVPRGDMEIGGSIEDTYFQSYRNHSPQLAELFNGSTGASLPTNISAEFNDYVIAKLSSQPTDLYYPYLVDPGGLLGDAILEVDNWWGFDIPAECSLVLPRGIWVLEGAANYTTASVDADTQIEMNWEYAEDTSDPAGDELTQSWPIIHTNNNLFANTYAESEASRAIIIAVTDPTLHIIPYLNIRNNPNTLTINFMSVRAMRLR